MAKYGFAPDFAVHPGATLKEALDERAMPQTELALRAGLSEKAVSQIINGVAPISFETAIKLERVLGIPARVWNNLQRGYQEVVTARSEADRLSADWEWLKSIPVNELIARKQITGQGTQTDVLREVLAFFAVSDVDAWRKLWESTDYLFKRSKTSVKHPGKVATWLRLGELQAQRIGCDKYSDTRFRAVLNELRALTVQPPAIFAKELVRLCASAGVAAVIVPEIPSAGIRGATRWLSKNKALIQLSLLYKTADIFWFNLFHEAGHVVLHGRKGVFLEWEAPRDRDTRQTQSEQEADAFARDLLIPPQQAARLPALKKDTPLATARAITGFAKQTHVAPGIVVGRMQHDGLLDPAWCNGLKRKLS